MLNGSKNTHYFYSQKRKDEYKKQKKIELQVEQQLKVEQFNKTRASLFSQGYTSARDKMRNLGAT